MDVSSWSYLLLFIFLVFSALFSASETAIMSANRIRIKHQADRGDKRASLVQKLKSDSGKFLGSILVGNNLVNIAFSSLITSISLAIFNEEGVGIAVAISTALIVLFAEILPKSLVASNPEVAANRLALPAYWLVKIFRWPSWIFTVLVDLLFKLTGMKKTRSAFITPEELESIVETAAKEGSLDTGEKEMIQGIFKFADTDVEDIMVPRPDIIGVSADLPAIKAASLVGREQYSRIPIYSGSLENIVGFVHVKDLLSACVEGKDDPVTKLLRPVLFVPRTKKVDELFNEMRVNNQHLAIVLDEYGTTAGLATMEDILEEIMGEIRDEYDETEELIIPVSEGTYLINGRVSLFEIGRELGIDLYQGEDVDTIGGLVFHQLGHIPVKGDNIEAGGVSITVEEMRGKRVAKVRLEQNTDFTVQPS